MRTFTSFNQYTPDLAVQVEPSLNPTVCLLHRYDTVG